MKQIICWAAIVMFFCTPFALAAEELRYVGSSTIGTSIVKAGAAETFTRKSGTRFVAIEEPGSGRGIQALIEGRTTLAGSSRSLRAGERKQGVIGTVIGYDAIAVFVHASNPITNLTKEQLQGIFTGAITNWKEVGGRDAPIAPNTEIQGAGRATIEMFTELVLDGAAHGEGFKEIDLPRDQLIEVASNPNAICGVSLGLLAAIPADQQSRIKAVAVNGLEPTDLNVQSGAYLIARPLVLATRGLPSGQAREFIRFMLSPEGQAIVSKNFVPARR